MPPRIPSPAPLQHQMYAWRKYKKVTLQQVADAIGSTKGHLSNIENGKREMMPAVAEAVARLFGISVEMLMRRRPGEEVDLEQELLSLFRGVDQNTQKAMITSVRAIAELDRRQG